MKTPWEEKAVSGRVLRLGYQNELPLKTEFASVYEKSVK